MVTAQPVLVGVDFTECSRAALRQALRIGAARGAAVHAVHVVDTLVVVDLQEAIPPLARGIRDQSIADARAAWAEFRRGLPGAESVTFHADVDNRVVGLLRRVTDLRAGLLVLGAYGTREPETGLGTMASSAVRNSPVDVLLVRDSQAGGFRRVVACVDFSHASRIALDRAAALAAADGAELRVVHVYEPPWTRLNFQVPALETARYEDEHRQSIVRRLNEFVSEAHAAVTAVRPVCELFDSDGHRSGIAEYAQRVGADLIVLGTRGRTNVRDILLGSTAEKALQRSRCSVLAVRPTAAEEAAGEDGSENSSPLRPEF